MNTRLRRIGSGPTDESGQALIEFVLILPLFLVLIFGMLDFGKAYNYWIDANHLASTGARYAAVNNNPGASLAPAQTLQQYIRSQADTDELKLGGTDSVAAPISVCISFPAGPDAGKPVEIETAVTYRLLPWLGDRLSITTVTIHGKATMRLESAPSSYSEANNLGPCP